MDVILPDTVMLQELSIPSFPLQPPWSSVPKGPIWNVIRHSFLSLFLPGWLSRLLLGQRLVGPRRLNLFAQTRLNGQWRRESIIALDRPDASGPTFETKKAWTKISYDKACKCSLACTTDRRQFVKNSMVFLLNGKKPRFVVFQTLDSFTKGKNWQTFVFLAFLKYFSFHCWNYLEVIPFRPLSTNALNYSFCYLKYSWSLFYKVWFML